MKTRDAVYISVFAAITAVCSWLSVPAAVEFTMQTFAVFSALLVLGGRRGTLAIAVYLLLGLIGAPVFAGFTGGPAPLFGVTGGYLVGFLVMGLVYWSATRIFGERLPVQLAALLLGLAALYAFGTAWFMAVYAKNTGPVGLGTALAWCVFPFVPFDIAKLCLAVLVSKRVKRIIRLSTAAY